jgi:hypothetical protein
MLAVKQVCVRKKQQVEDALQLVRGLQKGIDTGKLLSGWQATKHTKHTTAGPPAADGTPETAPAAKHPAPGPATAKPQKGDSNRISLDLYKEGIPIQEIASRRKLTVSTVETHLTSFIFTGEIAIGDIVPEQKIAPILAAIKELGGAALGPIRGRLGQDYSFAEIRAVLNHLKHTESAN